MTDNVRKIFDMLGIEPNEKFKLKTPTGTELEEIYRIDSDLCMYRDNQFLTTNMLLINILKGGMIIVKLPKEPNKKKLRDLTPEEWDKWKIKNCITNLISCDKCIFRNAICYKPSENYSWIHHKGLYSDKFLNQEIEVEE